VKNLLLEIWLSAKKKICSRMFGSFFSIGSRHINHKTNENMKGAKLSEM